MPSKTILKNTQLRARKLLAPLVAGVVVGLSAVFTGIGVAALAFPDDLQIFMPGAIATVLFSAAILAAVTGLLSSRPGLMSLPQELPAAIIGLVTGSVAVTLPATLPIDDRFMALIMVMGGATAVTGLTLFILGYFRLGKLIRFIPYPVVGGMLASLGWLLLQGGVSIAAGMSPDLRSFSAFTRSTVVLQIGVGVTIGVFLTLLVPKIQHHLALPGLLVLFIPSFYLVAAMVGVLPTDLMESGWLLGPFPEGVGWRPPTWTAITNVDLFLFIGLLPTIATLAFVSTVTLLLYATGAELIIRADVDLDHELRVNGIANMLSGAGGGFPGFHSVSDTLLMREMGALTRPTVLVASLSLVALLLAGLDTLVYFPRPVVAGLLFYLGYLLLHDWVIISWRHLPAGDYAIILGMTLVSALIGYLEAIGLGLIAGTGLFVVTYSRLNVTKFQSTGAVMRSNVDRPDDERQCLTEYGDRILVMGLQGFLFFGTAHSVFIKVRDHCMHTSPSITFVVLDFRLVTGLDSSSVTTFRKLRNLAEDKGVQICLTDMSDKDRKLLIKNGVTTPEGKVLYLQNDLDHGLEDCEEAILDRFMPNRRTRNTSMAALPEWLLQRVQPYLDATDYPKGACIIRQGDTSKDLFFVRQGRVTVRFEQSDTDGPGKRLRSYGPGTVVGEAALYLGQPRSASIYAETDTKLLRMQSAALERMADEDPATAVEFHKFVVRLLSDRMMATNALVQTLL